ncbi:MAG: histidine kinase [Planctomycetes bacterium]|nr:histidine kinase [Planctomycetota bacterium]
MAELALLFSAGIAPTLCLAFLLGHLMGVQDVRRLATSTRGRLRLGLVFGLLSAAGALFGLRQRGVYVDTALFVVVAGGLEGGPMTGLVAGLLGACVRFLDAEAMRGFAPITFLGAVAGGIVHEAARGRPLRAGPAFGLGVAVGTGQGLVTALLLPHWPGIGRVLQAIAPLSLLTGLGLVGFLFVLSHLEAYAESARLRAELAETRVRFLQAQIRPHFLFNALNTLGSLVRTDAVRAREVVQNLAEFLRATFRPTAPLVPLSEELSLVRAYVDVEKARFGDRLRYDEGVPPACVGQTVPALLLQPIVENSVRHGFRADGGSLAIGLTARRDGEWLLVTIQDDGAGIAPTRLERIFVSPACDGVQADGAGIGLRNGRERLERLYPGQGATLTLTSEVGRGTRTEARVPWRAAPGESGPRAEPAQVGGA